MASEFASSVTCAMDDEDIDAFKTKLAMIVRELEAKCDGEPVASDDDDAAESTVSNSAASCSNSAASGAK